MDFLGIKNEESFNDYSIKLFNYHFEKNKTYQLYCKSLNIKPEKIDQIEKIPFLPIIFFKHKKIFIKDNKYQKVFKSSGTGGLRSSHFIYRLKNYDASIEKCFERVYGKISDHVIIGVTPSFKSKSESSLIYMINKLIKKSKNNESQFLMDPENFDLKTKQLEKNKTKYIIYGLSYALMDLIDNKKYNLKNSIIIETGGMKGLKKEIDKEDLHNIFSKGFNTRNVHSEYAMTELLSQSYSIKDQIFNPPNWKKVLVKDFNDPFKVSKNGRGFLNIIDLANKYSCPFIATEDVGEVFKNGEFKLFGRGSEADIRGCNLMLTGYAN